MAKYRYNTDVEALLCVLSGLGISITLTYAGNLHLEPEQLIEPDLWAMIQKLKDDLQDRLLDGEADPEDPFTIGAQVAHCGSCRHFLLGVPDMPDTFGRCLLGWKNHIGERRPDPVYTRFDGRCMVKDGKGWYS